MTKGWRDWFRRVSEKKAGDWEVYDLNQCLTLSLSGMGRNDSLLISTSYFWSNALSAFVFGHGPMTITLADVYMLTGLRITGSMQSYDYLSARSKKMAKISDYTGWASYILNHIGDGLVVTEREYVARKIHLLWVILWSNLQSQTYGRASGSGQGHRGHHISSGCDKQCLRLVCT